MAEKDPKTARPNVLLVDDDPGVRDMLTIGLQRRGFNVVAGGSAEDALRIARNPAVPIDVVVMDLFLPDSWGAEVVMEFRAARPDIEVVFISGYADADPVLEASASGEAFHFLTKPFSVSELDDLIRQVLSGSAPER